MRRTVKRDSNHAEIVAALNRIGATVIDLAAMGGGTPDVLCGYRKKNVLLEIKRPGVAGKKRGAIQNETNRKQLEFRERWKGYVAVVTSVDEALIAVGVYA